MFYVLYMTSILLAFLSNKIKYTKHVLFYLHTLKAETKKKMFFFLLFNKIMNASKINKTLIIYVSRDNSQIHYKQTS